MANSYLGYLIGSLTGFWVKEVTSGFFHTEISNPHWQKNICAVVHSVNYSTDSHWKQWDVDLFEQGLTGVLPWTHSRLNEKSHIKQYIGNTFTFFVLLLIIISPLAHEPLYFWFSLPLAMWTCGYWCLWSGLDWEAHRPTRYVVNVKYVCTLVSYGCILHLQYTNCCKQHSVICR